MTATISKDDILEAIANMKVAELVELKDAFMTKFNVTISAVAAAPAGGGAGGGAAAAAPPPPAPPAATAAMVTLNFVLNASMSSVSSMTDMLPIASRISSLERVALAI